MMNKLPMLLFALLFSTLAYAEDAKLLVQKFVDCGKSADIALCVTPFLSRSLLPDEIVTIKEWLQKSRGQAVVEECNPEQARVIRLAGFGKKPAFCLKHVGAGWGFLNYKIDQGQARIVRLKDKWQ